MGGSAQRTYNIFAILPRFFQELAHFNGSSYVINLLDCILVPLPDPLQIQYSFQYYQWLTQFSCTSVYSFQYSKLILSNILPWSFQVSSLLPRSTSLTCALHQFQKNVCALSSTHVYKYMIFVPIPHNTLK